MTARSKRTDEIRARVEAGTTFLNGFEWPDAREWDVDFGTPSWDSAELIANAPADLEYLLARVERLEGLLREVNNWTELPEPTSVDLADRIDAALGDES